MVDDIKINSKLTLGEDVADLGGRVLAYIAWKNATRGQSLKPTDGFCSRPAVLHRHGAVGVRRRASGKQAADAITDPHSPLEYRINGVVSNMPEFQKAFACKAGAQPMVPGLRNLVTQP